MRKFGNQFELLAIWHSMLDYCNSDEFKSSEFNNKMKEFNRVYNKFATLNEKSEFHRLAIDFDLGRRYIRLMESLTKTYEFIVQAHAGVLDKGGNAYFLHPLAVMSLVNEDADATLAMLHAALLHDVVEDTDYTFDDLLSEGFSEEVVELVKLLTKEDGETYNQYLDRLIGSGNVGAMKIKLADNTHNSLEERLEYLDEDKQNYLRKKYTKSKARLVEALENVQV